MSPTPTTTLRLPPQIDGALVDFVARVREHFGPRPVSLTLFGSYARGDFGPESDVDVLVLMDTLGNGERREVYDLAEEVYFSHLIHVAPLVHSTAEFDTIARREYLIASEIARDGVAL